ncbi:DUF86 domain-containing protein [Pseudomonas sp. S2_H01]
MFDPDREMFNAALQIKVGSISRHVERAKEEFEKDSSTFADDISRYDAAILNIIRAFEAAASVGQLIIFHAKLGVPRDTDHVFDLLLSRCGLTTLMPTMSLLADYCHKALHDDQVFTPLETSAVITDHLDVLIQFAEAMLANDLTSPP